MRKNRKFFIFLLLILAILLPAFFVYGCNYHAYRDCVGTAIFWYDSCTNREDFYQDCAKYNLTCKYGQCIEKQIASNYVAHFKSVCYNQSVYWYDSLGKVNGLQTDCQDANSCTQDECFDAKCSNVLKCDGTTCQPGSIDFNSYCLPVQPDVENNNLSVSFFIKENSLAGQWDKSAQIGQNQDVYFMIVLNNNGQQQIDENIIAVNIPAEVSYLGNLKVDDVSISGDIVSGVNVGAIQGMQKKTITFEGKTQSFATQEEKQASVFINSIEPHQSDSVLINFDATQNDSFAEQSQAQIFDWVLFFKKWFMWIIAGIVLIFLFTIIFRRISSNV
jgi:hypothetical protein